jgi:hypothetical protein
VWKRKKICCEGDEKGKEKEKSVEVSRKSVKECRREGM